jgi:hypothetical protein
VTLRRHSHLISLHIVGAAGDFHELIDVGAAGAITIGEHARSRLRASCQGLPAPPAACRPAALRKQGLLAGNAATSCAIPGRARGEHQRSGLVGTRTIKRARRREDGRCACGLMQAMIVA